ncbi:energy transducer TonB [Flocculibacter collagenilyticus]|uniref:energy transducer TonB n=1 Tax=Flocculibacter collagenilyticus TaxID=2744479 RepID=UPI001F27405E|nr:energy transducer TonB [Flocculibacter collagenilyticus]
MEHTASVNYAMPFREINASKPIKLLGSLVIGSATTFGLFAFMSYLISGPQSHDPQVIEYPEVEIFNQVEDTPVDENVRKLPSPPEIPEMPPQIEQSTVSEATSPSFAFDGFDLDIGTDLKLSNDLSAGADNEAMPIVRIDPKYPIAAAREGIEGWVELSFTISGAGTVENVKVIEALPDRMFNREAIRALRKWKYKPKTVDGKSVALPNQRIRLEFSLNY